MRKNKRCDNANDGDDRRYKVSILSSIRVALIRANGLHVVFNILDRVFDVGELLTKGAHIRLHFAQSYFLVLSLVF